MFFQVFFMAVFKQIVGFLDLCIRKFFHFQSGISLVEYTKKVIYFNETIPHLA